MPRPTRTQALLRAAREAQQIQQGPPGSQPAFNVLQESLGDGQGKRAQGSRLGALPLGRSYHPSPGGVSAAGRAAQPTGCQW